MNILILGGYGNSGSIIADLLIKETESKIVIAGRSLEKAQKLAEQLNSKFSMSKCSALKVDVDNQSELRAAIESVNLVVVASSTSEHVQKVAKVCIEKKVDYIDTQLSTNNKLKILEGLKDEISSSGCCFITDAGFHPGVPAALVRYSERLLDKIDKANIYSLIRENWKSYDFSESTIIEMVEEFLNYKPIAYKNKEWVNVGYQHTPVVDFGEGLGKKKCVPFYLNELKILTEQETNLTETGFYVSGFNWFFDNITVLVVFAAGKIYRKKIPKWLLNFFEFSLKKFCVEPFVTKLKFVAEGTKEGKSKKINFTLSSPSGYYLTAVPTVACIKQLLFGDIKKPGLHYQALIVEPNQFLNDIDSMGVKLTF